MSKLTSHPEFNAAAEHFIQALDMPEYATGEMRALIECSLVRVFFRFWLQQTVKDAVWIAVGEFIDGRPALHRIDGWPEQGDGVLDRKWMQRARLWIDWDSIDVWHVIDWLATAERDNHLWLYSLDDEGHPKKLTKCGTLERLVVEATKGLRYRSAQPQLTLDRDEEVHVAGLGDGHSLVQILTPNALRREGIRMHNCLRHGDHGNVLTSTPTRYFSVRDPDDKPIGTLEVHLGHVRQFAGPCNLAPTSDVIDRVAAVADAWGWHDLHAATSEFHDPDDDPRVAAAFENRRRI
ncbi:hypothetical protein MNR02_14785 [Shinella sp. H4-D48]|uniref:hypothetical protein n=1 Tax=Shinella sp. H4-D48 TaxID=2925841 RepID=UPI001F537794|nr:hypothetical protein [Shinella sp. H4-D48]UNK37714.1 hypothetical protein MNR02_14785 [Shinella sp. H4-D48]